LSVGIPGVDEDHTRFITLVDGLNQAILDRKCLSEIRKCMQLLLDDADEHAQLTEKLRAMDEFIANKTEYEWVAAVLKIKEALLDHLLNEDMKCRDYYRSMPR